MTVAEAPALAAEYFDGRSAQAHPVTLTLHGLTLLIHGQGFERQASLGDVRWPERQRHGVRRIELPDGGTLRCLDAAAFDAFARAAGAADSLTVRVQQSWRWTLAAVAVLVLLTAAGYRWGLPAATRGVLAFVPAAVDERLGESAYQSVQPLLLQPTAVTPQRQGQLQQAFEQAIARVSPGATLPRLRFHAARRLGPNAFALPGGIIVVTDELLQRLAGRDELVLGVLAHEFGHVRARHGMRLLVQTTLLGAATSVTFGDFSTLLASLPALLGQLGYSRDFEREADDDAIAVLRANTISPAVMVDLFELLQRRETKGATPPASPASRPGDADAELGIAFSSHPADAERIARFKAASTR
ncbi:MAG TPA: M48 family metallopeptidase [Burkholderiaceae bacterium]|nr:M48 family metallopeptidase [Burkholderiaceae bacterium]